MTRKIYLVILLHNFINITNDQDKKKAKFLIKRHLISVSNQQDISYIFQEISTANNIL